jgi:hypothetical protein
MRASILAISFALVLAACGQSGTAPAAPEESETQSLFEQVRAMSPERQPVFAWEQLTAWQAAHPEAQPSCASIRHADVVGVIPDDVDEGSLYADYRGALVFTVQCGAQLTTVQDDAREQWLVAFAPGATEAAVANCADTRGFSQCPRTPPRAQAPTD